MSRSDEASEDAECEGRVEVAEEATEGERQRRMPDGPMLSVPASLVGSCEGLPRAREADGWPGLGTCSSLLLSPPISGAPGTRPVGPALLLLVPAVVVVLVEVCVVVGVLGPELVA